MLWSLTWQSAALCTEKTGTGQKLEKSDGHLTAGPGLSLGQKHHKGGEHAMEFRRPFPLTDLLLTSPCLKYMLTWKLSPPGARDKQRSSADSEVSN